MNGKGDCAKENDNIPFVNGKSPAAHTQQIQSRDSDDNADPELYPRLLMQKQGKDRNQNDIHRCDKSGLSHRRVLNTDLLQIAGYKQYHTAGNTSGQESLSLRSPALRRFLPGDRVLRSASASSPKNCDHRQQKKPCQKRS